MVLMGSPNSSGSSALLAENFIRGAKEQGHTVKRIDAAHVNESPCTGCIACGYEGPCVQKDDEEVSFGETEMVKDSKMEMASEIIPEEILEDTTGSNPADMENKILITYFTWAQNTVVEDESYIDVDATIEKNRKRKLTKHKKTSNNSGIEIARCPPFDLLKLQKDLSMIADGEGIGFVCGKGRKKPEIQQLYEELEACGCKTIIG